VCHVIPSLKRAMLPVVENIYHFKLFFQIPAQPATGMDYGEMVANEMLIFLNFILIVNALFYHLSYFSC
jgi:fumarate reductase subunit C